jgi:hypothetical protein
MLLNNNIYLKEAMNNIKFICKTKKWVKKNLL